MQHGLPLVLDEMFDWLAQEVLRQPVGRTRDPWDEPSCDLVFTLGAGFEELQPVLDTVVDSAVITGLEMEEIDLLDTPPVPAIECRVTAVHQRTRNGLAVEVSQHEQDTLRHGPRDLHEEALVEGGDPPLLVKCLLVEAGKVTPVCGGRCLAIEHPDSHTRLPDTTPFPQDILALARGESREEIIEITVTVVVPVKLAVVADHESRLPEQVDLVLLGEQQVKTACPGLRGERPCSLQQ